MNDQNNFEKSHVNYPKTYKYKINMLSDTDG